MQLEGRVTTSLLTPYPPGIPLLIPGERFNRKIVDYLRFTREFNAAFPGFDTDVHGLVEESRCARRPALLRRLRPLREAAARPRAGVCGQKAVPPWQSLRPAPAAPAIAWLKPPST